MARTMGRGGVRAGGRGVGGGVGRDDGQAGERGSIQGGVQSRDRGVGDVDDDSAFHLMNSPIESSDSDDELTIHVAPTRQGRTSHVQVPEPIICEWIWVV
ncbi:hypothetical protein Hanom_Chr01g00074861 [Helianthus anomalus]